MDHDFKAFPFTVKRCSKWQENASAPVTTDSSATPVRTKTVFAQGTGIRATILN